MHPVTVFMQIESHVLIHEGVRIVQIQVHVLINENIFFLDNQCVYLCISVYICVYEMTYGDNTMMYTGRQPAPIST